MNTDTPDYERFAHEWSNGTSTKVAIGFDYDEQTVERLKTLDWSETHASYEPDYQFMSGRESAWAVDATPSVLATVRDLTGLAIPQPDEPPINTRPFPDGSSSIQTRTRSISEHDLECAACGVSGVLSAMEYERVYKRAQGLKSELLLDPDADPSHLCTSCGCLYIVPVDERSEMAKAMGEPA